MKSPKSTVKQSRQKNSAHTEEIKRYIGSLSEEQKRRIVIVDESTRGVEINRLRAAIQALSDGNCPPLENFINQAEQDHRPYLLYLLTSQVLILPPPDLGMLIPWLR